MSVDDLPSFGALLRQYRKIAELTQEELAERAHLSVRGISDLERGARHSPRADTLALLVEALGLVGEARTRFEAAARSAEAPDTPLPPATSRSRFGRPSVSPMIGRNAERAALERHLAGSGPPVFLLAGEPGIGTAIRRRLRLCWKRCNHICASRARPGCAWNCRAAPGWCGCCRS
jgi:DNA-binding XRE family transcriptional regulator